ncbi:MAG TPA: STAS domain-containing protein, partial [Fibrobacteraceae bacterium]|nr:STAS domain-containing protein [Fibrobacteraceae bacterium]
MRQIRGPYLCYTVEKDFLTSHVIEQKSQILADLNDSEHDIALDIQKLRHLDSLSLRFIINIDEQLERRGKRLVLVGGEPEVLDLLTQQRRFKHYPTMADFELEFHDLNPTLFKSILQLAKGGNGFKMLRLECPVCHCTDVAGFVLDDSMYEQAWLPDEIVPVWSPVSPDAEHIDFAAYRVAVCPSCFFASVRPDHFVIHFPEGEVKSILKPDQITNLAMGQTTRKSLALENRDSAQEEFFQPPRNVEASYLSWKLQEACQKQLCQDRHFIDAFEIVLANFMMCKYVKGERQIDDHLHTALAWLNNVMQNQSHYSTQRLIQAHTYHVSVLLALDKPTEAVKALKDFSATFIQSPEAQFWLQRAESLVNAAIP